MRDEHNSLIFEPRQRFSLCVTYTVKKVILCSKSLWGGHISFSNNLLMLFKKLN